MMDGKTIRDKLVGSKSERAVSPVIGVILMVAITVILAAVIAAFVLDLGDMGQSANAGIEFDESGDHVTPQVIDKGNTDAIYVEINDGDNSEWVDTNGENATDPAAWDVGDSVTMNVSASNVGETAADDDLVETEFTALSGIEEIIVYGEVEGEKQVITTWDE